MPHVTAIGPFVSAIGPSELSTVLILLIVVAVPVAAIAFSRSGSGLKDLGKGTFAIDKEEPTRRGSPPPPVDPAAREEEVRQMVEAAAFRKKQRGEEHADTEAEIQRLLGGGQVGGPTGEGADEAGDGGDSPAMPLDPETAQIRSEIRELVIANNERRERRGEEPLDVESEVDKRLREWS